MVLDDAFVRAAETAEPSARARTPAENWPSDGDMSDRSRSPGTPTSHRRGGRASTVLRLRSCGLHGSAARGPASSE
ncbi:SCO2583/SCO2584 N-terminal domain-containing protein [Streptomyces prasinus]|uniref:SCO2583/SCO2584 N-terminal domain-containing protein n=1 Tax=Streptomyces prasinus TaxID=67345 RepID=UPI0036C13055